MSKLLLTSIALLAPPTWILWILVFCILYPLVAVLVGIDWPFDKTLSWKEHLRLAEEQAKPRRQPRPQIQTQVQVEPELQSQVKPEPEPEPELEPQTNQQLIDEVIAGLQNLGFKKRDAKITVLKACEGKVFEDHQSLVEAALNKSNL